MTAFLWVVVGLALMVVDPLASFAWLASGAWTATWDL